MVQRGPEFGSALDGSGATISLLCAIHCAVMPLLVGVLPILGLGFLAHGWFEWLLVATSACLGISSLSLGYRKHGTRSALAALAGGVSLLGIGRILEQRADTLGVVLVVAGGITIASSHVINRRLCRACEACRHTVPLAPALHEE